MKKKKKKNKRKRRRRRRRKRREGGGPMWMMMMMHDDLSASLFHIIQVGLYAFSLAGSLRPPDPALRVAGPT